MLIFTSGLVAVSAVAAPYDFETGLGTTVTVDVEAWAGTGENETILVVDWNKLDDNGADTVSESHAFGYRWDGTAYESDMLSDFNDTGVLAVDAGNTYSFVMNIAFADEDELWGAHMHVESGSWNLASTSDPYAYWGGWGDPNSGWDFNTAGMNEELLADGQFEGINAIMYYGTMPSYANDQLDIPLVPEPASLGLFGICGMILISRKRRSR